MSISTSLKDQSSTGFFGHPKTLSNLFSIEMWERFSFYGMQAILAYYMYFSVADGGLGIPQDLALSLVGAYGGAVYLSTILGAWLADRLLGSEKVLLCSAFLIMAGHLALAALPGATGLAAGLVLVAIGSGGLKANATALVGSLYSKEDTRRDAGFSIFYMGVNIGGLLGPLLTGFLQQRWGFHVGFAAAAIGMAIGVGIYLTGRKNLPDSVKAVGNPLPAGERRKYLLGLLAFIALVVVAFALKIVTAESLARTIAYAVILASVIYFTLMLRSKRVTAVERKHVLAFIPLYIASAAFWALFQQQFTFIAVYSQERLDRSLFGWEMPASWVQSINPVFIIVLAGVFAALWTKMGTRQPGTVVKFSLSLVLVGLAFLVFIPMNSLEKTPLLVLVGILLLCTLAELLLSPIGQSVTTKLAPAAFGTQMIALFFLSVSLGTTLAGILAGFYTEGNEVAYFLALGGTAIVLGVALLLAAPALKKLMGEVR
ncbi:oligopeptide:H+ symporter [Paeniglutamicibacter sp. ABSL32-1]|uniref:peptide MFS transporter n=1 Tax=Paeniglutamicibacter quisquiliarum TaxID=2849498 RepID=UPI001C2DAA01|nr:oligopeptide:H+ symporter [Paeniglutamicibacter quisquiliarum]MBV1781143.1 oligopeptide:H+ symporter [Paeniglutamicibacter quisquiliarum]